MSDGRTVRVSSIARSGLVQASGASASDPRASQAPSPPRKSSGISTLRPSLPVIAPTNQRLPERRATTM